jgi:hypothetical protein
MTATSILLFVHVALSLVGIGAGFVVLFGLIGAKRLDGWTAVFLATTTATSVTGFFFPYNGFTPAIAVGIVSVLVLGLAIHARYIFHLAGAWRRIYVVTAVIAQYLNVFVLVVQLFQKVPSLQVLAPTQSEPPFLAAQLIVLVLFAVLGVTGVKRFRVEPLRAA